MLLTGWKKAIRLLLFAALLLVTQSALCENPEIKYFRDAIFEPGIYFSISHPQAQENGTWLYASGKSFPIYNLHLWKTVTINVSYRYLDDDGYIVSAPVQNGKWEIRSESGKQILEMSSGEDQSSVKIYAKNPGTAVIYYSAKGPNNKSYTANVTFNVRSLSVGENTDTLKYAALSILSYSHLTPYQDTGHSLRKIFTPERDGGLGGEILQGETSILENDKYSVYADIRDFIIAAAGDCTISSTSAIGSFYGVLYKCGEQYIMAFRGTEISDNGDIGTDVDLALGKTEQGQFQSAVDFYLSNDNLHPFLTGHSLGGGLANYVSILTGANAVTFNAPSTMVTGISNFLTGIEERRFGRNFKGLDDGLRTDYVNSLDVIGKLGIGDNDHMRSGNLDRSIFIPSVSRNSHGFPLNHSVQRMILYDPSAEKVSLNDSSSSTNPSKFEFFWENKTYVLGSIGDDSLTYTDGLLERYIFSGAGNDSIKLSAGPAVIVAGEGDDYIVASSVLRADHQYYYFPGHGKDTIIDSSGNDTLYIFDFDNVSVKHEAGDHYYVSGNGSDTHLADIYVGSGTGTFRILDMSGTEIQSIKRNIFGKTKHKNWLPGENPNQ